LHFADAGWFTHGVLKGQIAKFTEN
jgi:hypothetical protein